MSELNSAFAALPASPKMPALFVGHGNPMNGIEDNAYSRAWREIGDRLPKPNAILVVSAHWMTRGGVLAHIGEKPKTIHDFGGFPPKLFAQQYPAPGAPDYAKATMELVRSSHIDGDERWGLDHGAWTVLMRMFPKADIPVFQLSLDLTKSPKEHVALAAELKPLREKGVLILGSGNIVHNLGAIAPGAPAYDWAQTFDAEAALKISARDAIGLGQALNTSRVAKLSNPTPEHFLPSLYPLAVADEKDELSFFSESFDLASISMRSFLLS